jgi:hypothetical protein
MAKASYRAKQRRNKPTAEKATLDEWKKRCKQGHLHYTDDRDLRSYFLEGYGAMLTSDGKLADLAGTAPYEYLGYPKLLWLTEGSKWEQLAREACLRELDPASGNPVSEETRKLLIGLLAANSGEAIKHGARLGHRRLVFQVRDSHWQNDTRSKNRAIAFFIENHGSGMSQKEVAALFNVSREQIRKITKKVREGQT